ncbi:class B sortase [Neobacillus sp. CF12]|uniref:class B sortase n=1 Tax=Neobacillus sp. CF12 TaxID=3055864 RepID=UPI0025A24FC6|nr:class B sortase [Neobacillus sp. CF12]MDM5327526.1 class B sortase [Neobacillus sp. CF12]
MKKVNLSLKQKVVWRKFLFTILLAGFFFSTIMIARRAVDSYNTKTLNNELSKIQEKINVIGTSNNSNQILDNIDDLETKDKSIVIYERERIEEENKDNEIRTQIEQLAKVNRDIKGWIRIENTLVNYPVVQTDDNSFYLEHDAGKNKNRYGTIFIDEINDVSNPEKLQGQNIILYGHHMKNGDESMFGSLERFREYEFFTANDSINFNLFPESYKFQVFGVYLVNQDFDYRNTRLGTELDIKNLLNRLKNEQIQFREVTLTPNDTILTLSTCAYDFEDARLVIMAKLINDGNIKGTNQ